MAKPSFHIGISGWRYVPWRGTFYPKGLTQKRELEFASRQVNSIEINGSFYSPQRPSSYREWHDAVPDDFVFSLKGGRFITHMKRLIGIETALANYLASGIFALKEKLGPILWQFPPNFQFDAERMEAFFNQLPKDTDAAEKIAREHDSRLRGRALVNADVKMSMRHAVEIRHESFESEEFIQLCRKYSIAIVVADTAGKWPMIDEVTADFMYVRLHGDEELYVSGYSDEALDRWAKRIKGWKKETFVYFDNDVKVHAPFDAMSLAKRLGVKWESDREFEGESSRPINSKERARESWPAIKSAKRA